MQEISSKTFDDCDNLETIHIIVNDYLYIENEAFFQCANLKEIIVKCLETDLIYISPQAIVECPMARFVFKNANTDTAIAPNLISKERLLENVRIGEQINEEERIAIEKSLIAFKARLPKLEKRYFPLEKTDFNIYFDGEITYDDVCEIKQVKFNKTMEQIRRSHKDRYDSEHNYRIINGLTYFESLEFDQIYNFLSDDRWVWIKKTFLGKTFLNDAEAMKILAGVFDWAEKETALFEKIKKNNKELYLYVMTMIEDIRLYFSLSPDIFDRYDVEKREIRINVKNIELLSLKFDIKPECLSSIMQLWLARGFYEAAYAETAEKMNENNADSFAKFTRIVAMKAMKEYDRLLDWNFCDCEMFLPYRAGQLECFPETICSIIDSRSDENCYDIYRLINERARCFPYICYQLIQQRFDIGEMPERYSEIEGGELVCAYRYYHPDQALSQVLDVLHWAERSHLEKAGIAKTTIDDLPIILSYAYENNDSLESVVIDERIQCVRGYAYAHCHNLKKLTVYNNCELVIEPYAFFDTGLEEIVVYGKGKVIMADYAFYDSRHLKNAFFENWNDDDCCVSEFAFAWCSDQFRMSMLLGENTNVSLANSRLAKQPVKYEASPYNLSRQNGESGISVRADSMFFFDTKLRTINIKKPLSHIHSLACYYNQNVEEMVIFNSDIAIDAYAFYKLPNLKRIEFRCETFEGHISPMAFYKVGEPEIKFSETFKTDREQELHKEAITYLIAGKATKKKPNQVFIEEGIDFKNDYLKWLCCNKIWEKKQEIENFIDSYFSEKKYDDTSKFAISSEIASQDTGPLNFEFDIDKIVRLCDAGLFSKETYKKDIASKLKDFRSGMSYRGKEMKAVTELNNAVYLKKGERKTLMELSVEDEELNQALKHLQNQISLCLNYDSELLVDFDMSKQRTQISFSVLYKNMITAKNATNLSFAMDLLEFSVAFGLSAQRLFTLYEKCDCPENKKAAVIKGCAYAIAMNYLYCKEDKTAYEIMLKEGDKGVFPYWPYALRGQLLYQCYDNWNNYYELLQDIIEKAHKNPLESIDMVFKICCAEEDPDLNDLIY